MLKTKNDTIKNTLLKTFVKIPKVGDIVEGTIIGFDKNGLFVDLDSFKTGIVIPRELKERPEYLKQAKRGNKIAVKIIDMENEDGYVEVSLKEAGSERGWEDLKKIMEEKNTVEAKVLKANKGGLILDINGFQAFMPVSQLSSKNYPRVEGGDTQKILQALQKLVNQSLEVKIISLDPDEEKLIVSEKATQEKELKETIQKYKIGDVIEGIITGIVDFGAFVKFDNIEGLIHISELDYQLIEDPRDIIKIGDKIKAKIIEIDKNKISLSIKALKDNPWDGVKNKYKVGDVIEGKVTKFNPFGAFVQLDKYIHGLAHISEFGTEEKMNNTLRVGEKYRFEIVSIKPSEYRMALKPIFEKEKSETKKTEKKVSEKKTDKTNKKKTSSKDSKK